MADIEGLYNQLDAAGLYNGNAWHVGSARPIIEAWLLVHDQIRDATHEAELTRALEERDLFHEWADKLAYAIAPESVIGEHSSLNNPWRNAVEIAENSAPLVELQAENERLRAECSGFKARLQAQYEDRLLDGPCSGGFD